MSHWGCGWLFKARVLEVHINVCAGVGHPIGFLSLPLPSPQAAANHEGNEDSQNGHQE